MNIFISWSKGIGMEIAIRTKQLLENIDPDISAFVSEIDIIGGEDVQTKIIERINQCDKLVLCFTKDTKKSPWLLFEAGYARGRSKTVIPFLFDTDPNWHSWIDNPMNIAREIHFGGNNFVDEFIKAFQIKGNAKNRRMIENYQTDILEIKNKYKVVDSDCEDIINQLVSNDAFHVENPYYRDNVAFFLTGFESYDLYKIITESFLYSGKYLWIYGRKNMKLFSGNFRTFFDYLKEKSDDIHFGMDGIDFRCLFLDPESEGVSTAHQQQEIFTLELTSTILRAKQIIGNNKELQKCFRMYSNIRDEIIIRIDNCIIYSRPVFDAEGRPQLLTNTGFEVFSAKSDKGQRCISKFEKVWDSARAMF